MQAVIPNYLGLLALAPMIPLLNIQSVTKTYNQTRAVDNISLSVPEQTIFGLLGPNGAGKTTLIRMITSILYQDEGSITLAGIPDNTQRNQYIGYMPEERGLYRKMRVGEHLLYLAQLKSLSRKQAKQKMDEWFTKFDIQDWRNKQIGELSKGMQQKIQFIATVIHDPKLIILDEPFSGLDPINTHLIQDEIFNLKQKGATILFSTHRMEQVEEICEQIALINNGKILLQGKVQDLKNRFKNNEFSLVYSGNLPQIPQYIFTIKQQNHQSIILQLREGYTANDVLNYFLQENITIHSFNEILPSLNQIFISQVNNGKVVKEPVVG